MKKLLPILFAIAVISTASNCKKTSPVNPVIDQNPGTLAMNFKAIYANKPLVINQIYDYNGKKIRFTRLQFLMSYDLGLLDSPVGEVLPSTSAVKFTGLTDTASAAAGISTEFSVSNKTWGSLNFAIGVPKVQNAKLPKDFTIPDALADGSSFWDAWQSYIFAKIEGSMDKDGDGIFETGITLHTGGNDAFTPLKFVKSVPISSNKTTTVNFELNVNELVKGIDLATVNSSHQVGDVATMKIIMGNFPTALTVK
jgi:hypothetical protein